ncbi:kinase domain-containing [Cryptosporidium sp. chipmunk genotype I]|uniref:kinase domain-containing n=1 Tax=Cryptosporidium sp. chipmunk genotype I TaxID=1280935 RepID=UPI00351A865E|nr:kinase domain-containing [Cryptosporidium sp. chipmunk genotype I]
MNNELNATIKNILKINEIQNDDLALMLSRYIQKNFLINTNTDFSADQDYIQEIIKVSITIITNCNLITCTDFNKKSDILVDNEEIPVFKNYIEFKSFRDLNNWMIDLYDRILFSNKNYFHGEKILEEKIQKLLDELNGCEIIPFELPIDFIVSIYNAGTISSEKIVDYLRSLHLLFSKNDENISIYGSETKDYLFCEDISIYNGELTEYTSDYQESPINNHIKNKRSFSEKVERELQKPNIDFSLRVSFSVGQFLEKMERELKTLEDITLTFFRTINSSFEHNINISDKKDIFLNAFYKNQLIHLIRQNIDSINISNRFLLVKVLHRGSFGQVYVGLDLLSFKLVCLKRLTGSLSDNQYLRNSLTEANYLKILSKSSVSKFVPHFVDVVVSNNNVFIISELQGKNLLSVLKNDPKKTYLTPSKIQRIIKQLLVCIKYLHESLKLIHCDIKPENIVVENINAHDIFGYLNDTHIDENDEINIKLIDWGSCLSIYQASSARNSYVQSRYYRSPEVCLGLPYNEKIDIWSIGCVMAELVLRKPLFDHNSSTQQLLANIITTIGKIPMQMINNSSTINHFITHDGHLFDKYLNKIRLFTTLNEGSRHQNRLSELFANSDPLFVDLLNRLLCIDPDERPSASQVLNHPWFSYDYLN